VPAEIARQEVVDSNSCSRSRGAIHVRIAHHAVSIVSAL